jgi:hypothetical protein
MKMKEKKLMRREMTIVDVNDLETVEQSVGRSGRITTMELPLPTGVRGVEMDFELATFSEGYGTPRHRHTFEQVRYVLDGKFQSQVGDLETNECGYYPEGVYYGPQHQDAAVTVLILQFPGPSGIPYVKHTDLTNARKRLIEEGGSFEGGVYTRVFPDGRKINKDAHAACFEAVTGNKMEFPEGRFAAPVFIRPHACRWTPDRLISGVENKHLGTFGEWRTGVSLMRVAPGAHLPEYVSEDAEIRFLLEGSITHAGKTWRGGQTRDRGTHMYIPHDGVVQEIATTDGALLFRILLPMIVETERMKNAPDRRASGRAGKVAA